MSEIDKMRDSIRKIGQSDDWARKVDLMPDTQVKAIYLRLKAQGKL